MSLTRSLWNRLAPPAPSCPALADDASADLIIIGAGFLGLSTALHAAEAGMDVVLLEAMSPGFGASGRNTGFVVPSLKSALGPKETEALLGKTYSARLLQLVAGSGDTVFGLIKRHGMEVAYRQNGWLQPGHSRQAEEMLKARLPALQSAGVDVEFLDRDAMLASTGLPSLHGGLRVASGGQINPLAYARGLARAAIAAGVRLHANSPATDISAASDGWKVQTPNGSVTGRQVVLTTNALVGDLCPAMRDGIVPVKVYQVATQPLPEEVRERVLPKMAPVADTRRHTFALRWSEDGRLITGGMVVPLGNRTERARHGFLSRIHEFVPYLPALEADAVWTGTIAATLDGLPRMVRLAPGLSGAIGCNGRGVALTSALGRELASLMAGHVAEADFALPITPPRPIPMARLSGLAPHLWLPWSALRDRLDARH